MDIQYLYGIGANSKMVQNELESSRAVWSPSGWKVYGTLDLSNMSLHKLPLLQQVHGDLLIYDNNLSILEGSPSYVGGTFDCSNNALLDLKEGPMDVKGHYLCMSNKLQVLKGAPNVIGGSFNCDNNYLEDLQGGPEQVFGYFSCKNNALQTLKGLPNVIDGYLSVEHNPLGDIQGLPELLLGGNFYHTSPHIKGPLYGVIIQGLAMDRGMVLGDNAQQYVFHITSYSSVYKRDPKVGQKVSIITNNFGTLLEIRDVEANYGRL